MSEMQCDYCQGNRAMMLWQGECAACIKAERDTLRQRVQELSKHVEVSCQEWADDHTHLQKLCREIGCTEDQVEGDSYYTPGIKGLADLLKKRVQELEETARLLNQQCERMEAEISRLKASTVPVSLGVVELFNDEPGERYLATSSCAEIIESFYGDTEAEARQKAADWIAAQHKLADLKAVQAQLNAQPVPDGLEVWPLDKEDK